MEKSSDETKKTEPKNTERDPCLDPEHEVPEKGHWRHYIVAIAAIVIIALFLLAFFPRYFQREELNKSAAVQEIIQVRTMKIKPETKLLELVLPSSLQAMRITPIWARADGYISKFNVDIGDVVKEGQLLVVLETPEVDKQYEQTKADLASAIARLEIARITSQRWNALWDHNSEAVSKQEVDQYNANYESAKADVLSFDANMKRLEKLRGFQNIYAPFDGIIIERDIDLGSLVTAGSNGNPQQLYRIAQSDILRVFVNVPQYYFRMISYGQSAGVSVSEFPDKVFPGIVARTSKALDPVARTLLTEVHIDNKDGELYPGLYADVKFELKPDTKSFIVPTEAVIIRSGEPEIAVLDNDNVVHLKTVKIGLDMGRKMQIVDGLQDNDIIVINPTDKIKDGIHVKILEPEHSK